MTFPNHHSTERPEPELLVDAKRVADLLAVSLRTVRKMDSSGKLPRPVRISGVVRWSIEELRAWIDGGAPNRTEWEARRRKK